MARKKGGLGQMAKERNEDLLGVVFGEETPKSEPEKPARVSKYMQLDRELVRAVKVYAAQNDLKEYEVMESALRQFLDYESD